MSCARQYIQHCTYQCGMNKPNEAFGMTAANQSEASLFCHPPRYILTAAIAPWTCHFALLHSARKQEKEQHEMLREVCCHQHCMILLLLNGACMLCASLRYWLALAAWTVMFMTILAAPAFKAVYGSWQHMSQALERFHAKSE